MTKLPTVDVLICGAGAAGLTLAIELARRGVSFRLIDKAEHPFPGSRGKGIQPRTLEVFEDLGIVNRIFAAGGAYPRQRSYDAGGHFTEASVIEQAEPTPAEPYPLPVMLPQFLTEKLMRERLAEFGVEVEFGRELIAIDQDPAGVVARIATTIGEEAIRAHYLVGSDGGRSFVRHALDIGFPGKTLGARALVADVVLTGLERQAWHRFNEGSMEQQLALCPLAGTDLFQIQAPVPPEGDVDLSVESLAAMVKERSGRSDISVRSVSWASAYSMNARLADRYRVGRVFLAGDAAHIHPPTGGQGLNTSVQDAYNLGWKLAAVIAGAPDTLLDSYEEERRPIAAGMLGLSTKLLDAVRQGDMRRGREVRQLDLGYPQSSLALERPSRDHGVLAGDRAPDGRVRGAGGQEVRLFDLFRGTHWTALGFEVQREALRPRPMLRIHTIGAGGELHDEHGDFQNAYDITAGHWVLVRPDGYIGAIVEAGEAEALEQYLGQVGLQRVGIQGAP